MNVIETRLPGVLIIEPRVHGDERGFFLETFRQDRYAQEIGISLPFVQDNHSRSRHGALRGLHAQRRHPQGKLVRAARGEVFDVAVDIDPASPTFSQWVSTTLSDSNHRQMWIPPGYAHGFLVLSEAADFEYKCTDYYRQEDEIGVIWNDPDIGIKWPLDNPTVSAKDRTLPVLSELWPKS
ncbi:MAG: dTDP-4-dehydrorhamnose 3,5-epimerase [Geminicoccales bacterium]